MASEGDRSPHMTDRIVLMSPSAEIISSTTTPFSYQPRNEVKLACETRHKLRTVAGSVVLASRCARWQLRHYMHNPMLCPRDACFWNEARHSGGCERRTPSHRLNVYWLDRGGWSFSHASWHVMRSQTALFRCQQRQAFTHAKTTCDVHTAKCC